MKSKMTAKPTKSIATNKRKYLSQEDVPAYSLNEAMRVIKSISDNYGGKTVRPIELAQALEIKPSSGPFRMLCGASIAYGLTDGGCNANSISVTDLGKQIVQPLDDESDLKAKRIAVLKPRIFREFFQKYDNSKFPKEVIAKNVLESMGVPRTHLDKVYKQLIDNAKDVGFLRKINDDNFVDLNGCTPLNEVTNSTEDAKLEDAASASPLRDSPAEKVIPLHLSSFINKNNNRVFITHGKNKTLVPQIGELLRFGNLEPVVSVQNESVAKPVPEKVMDDMRSCGAAIIHVEAESIIEKEDGTKEQLINPNVLIEIGAAMALYGKRFILLVRDGLKLPSNLQGLYEVRYEGEKLDADTTIRLLKAFNSMKAEPEMNNFLGNAADFKSSKVAHA